MLTGTPLPAFEHDPLLEHTSHFRLLRIIHGNFGQHVECEISTWPIDNAPSYYAISYTWGDPADTTEITVNGRPLIVRRNCEYVLQQAFASRKSTYFWVDAICIAQTTEEKNHQVGIMGKIYSNAEHVFACVGPHENDSEFLSKVTKDYRSLLGKIHQLHKGNWSRRYMMKRNRMLFIRCILSTKSEVRQRLYQSFVSFMKRSYFQRLWVIQELHLARDVSYCFGAAIEAANDFLSLYELLQAWADPRHYWFSKSSEMLTLVAGLIIVPSRTEASHAMRSTISGIDTTYPLLCMACTAAKQNVSDILVDPRIQCSDPRDRLFGILSIAKGQGLGHELKPDYTKDRFEVALDTLKLAFENDRCPSDQELYAEKLCDCFQITGEEASLRYALNLRCNTPGASAISNRSSLKLLQGQFPWHGFEISGSMDNDGLGFHVSVQDQQDQQDHCVLMLKEGSKKITLPAPLGTKRGDWWICLPQWIADDTASMFLVARATEGGTYNLIGSTYPFKFNRRWHSYFVTDHRFVSNWHPEDLLFFGWARSKMEWRETTQQQINEFVNRRLCAWDGSSYFVKQE